MCFSLFRLARVVSSYFTSLLLLSRKWVMLLLYCWGPKIGWSPQESQTSGKVTKKEEIKNLRKPVLASKVVSPFTRALAPPFIGR
jgi:hypothetical protein